jgi:hypothetical protein
VPLGDRKPHGPRRHRVEAALRALSVGHVAGLAQDQEPRQLGYDPGARGQVVNVDGLWFCAQDIGATAAVAF